MVGEIKKKNKKKKQAEGGGVGVGHYNKVINFFELRTLWTNTI